MTDARDPDQRKATRNTPALPEPRSVVVTRKKMAPSDRLAGLGNLSKRQVDVPALPPPVAPPRRQLHLIRWSLILFVLIPTGLFGLYIYLVASDQYVSEARFAVRLVESDSGGSVIRGDSQADGPNAKSVAAAVSPFVGAPNLGNENAEIVANYIHSRAIVDDVSRQVDLRAIFQRPEADLIARLDKDASAEELAAYWNRMVSVYVETSSGIVTVSASAFRRDDALAIAEAVLAASDALVNSLSRKVRADAMKTAEDEVRRSDGEVRFALSALTDFRNAHRIIDPMQASEATGKLLLKVLSDKIETEAQLYVTQRSQGPNAPGINGTKARLDSINRHVSELQEQMAGEKQITGNLAATLAAFENLELKRQFAERMYGFARDGVERARIATIRQTVYLAVFVPPSLPQDHTYPLRTKDFLLVGIAALMIWICCVTIGASIVDHRL